MSASSSFGYRKPQDLPAIIPVFPLDGAILFPRGALPLNIFEPRYLNMIDDVMGGDRIIGMIQPALPGLDIHKPRLQSVGCAGRVASLAETEDGRYLITLAGVSRFRLMDEIPSARPYRSAMVDFAAFENDLSPVSENYRIDRARLHAALKRYVAAKGYSVDWAAVERAPAEPLVHSLAAGCPFEPAEKQALLEVARLDERAAALITLLEIHARSVEHDDRRIQ